MGKWLDLAAQFEAEAGSGDNRDVRDNSAANVPIVPNVPQSLPSDVRAGLVTLQAMAAPRLARPEVWPGVVADAGCLASDGWAVQALSLGWTPLDLWGCSPVVGGNPDHEGLAVWLGGRRILLIDERTCLVDTRAGGRAMFTRRDPAGAVLLWDLGRAKC